MSSFTNDIVHDFYRRKYGFKGSTAELDSWFKFQQTWTAGFLSLLEIILSDHNLSPHMQRSIIRCCLYGGPHEADAELRVQQDERMKDLLMNNLQQSPTVFVRPEIYDDLQRNIRTHGNTTA